MHGAALAALGLGDHRYSAREVAPDELPAAIRRLREPDVLGANVTVPHKQAVMPMLDSLSAAAQAIGAVNTITNRGGLLAGDNTDAHGFEAALAAAGIELPGDRSLSVVVLGAGGSARAVVHALAPHARIGLVNRTQERAERLAADFAATADIRALPRGVAGAALGTADMIVNTTSVGMEIGGVDPQASPLTAEELPARGVVVDLIYRPARTLLLRMAAERGLKVENGLEMLVRQGARSLELWTGRQAPVDVMRRAAEQALAGTA